MKLSSDNSSNVFGHHRMVLKGLANMILLQILGGSAFGMCIATLKCRLTLKSGF